MTPNRHYTHSTNNSVKELQIKNQAKIHKTNKAKANHEYKKMLIRVFDEVFPD